ncbi:TPA: helix-turn-helix domain-containing protein [Streptococcus suis]
MKVNYSRVPFEVIISASNGDLNAITQIRNHFRPYIFKCSLRYMIDDTGKSKIVLDEMLFGRLEIRLISKVLSFEVK